MNVSLHIRDMPEELRDRITQRAAAHRQSVNSYLLDLIEREMRLPTSGEWLDGLNALPKAPGVTTEEIAEAIRDIPESSCPGDWS